MKAFKDLLDKLNKNKWAYWFIGVVTVLYISYSIHNKDINTILFAEYAPVASAIEIWLFIFMILYLIIKRAAIAIVNNKSKKL